MELVKINGGLTEKGNLKRDAHRQMRDQAVEAMLDGFELTPKGQYVKAIADVDGKTAYVTIELGISVSDTLFDEPKGKAKAEPEAETEVPSLFD